MHDKMEENETTNADPSGKQEMDTTNTDSGAKQEMDTTNADSAVKQEMDTSNADSGVKQEMDTTNAVPAVKQEMQVKIEDVKTKIDDINMESVESVKSIVTDNQRTEKNATNDDRTELLSNTLKRKRTRPKNRARRTRPQKSYRLGMVATRDKKPKVDSKSTSEAQKPPESLPPGVDESTSDDKTYDDMQDDVEYILTVSNWPNTWSYMDIKNYIDTECEPVDEMELLKDKKTGNGAIRLPYQSETHAKLTMNKLKDKVIDGHKLTVEMSVETLESDTDEQSETNERSWKPDMDEWDIDPKGVYGLKEEFLKSLDIQPPLDRWVGVHNFHCDKPQLLDILELAGKVLHISVFHGINKYASVMYRHPLEAVQAVSMLHKQQFYGKPLNVSMIRGPSETVLLPKGLVSIGDGLGVNGKPLRNVKKHYKKMLANEFTLVNPMFFDVPETSQAKIPQVNFKVRGVEILDKSFELNMPNNTETNAAQNQAPSPKPQVKPIAKPLNTIPTVNRPQVSNVPRLTNPQNMQQNFRQNATNGPFPRPNMVRPMGSYVAGPRPMGTYGPDPRMMRPFASGWNNVGPQRPMHGPVQMAGPMRGPMPRPAMQGPVQVPPRPIIYNTNDPVQLQLSNLPPSTTFNILCEKMAQCGQVVSIQLTTPGCAVVTFANRMQADNCMKTYNGTYVDGCMIQVKYT